MSPAADQKARPEVRQERRFSGAFEPSGPAGVCGLAPGGLAPGAGPAIALAALHAPGGLAALRAQVRRLEQGARLGKARPVAPLGLAALDDALPGGGLPLGALHEIEGERAEWDDGATLGFCLALLARLAKAGSGAFPGAGREPRKILWISRQGDLYPPALAGQGLDPGRFLLVRAKNDAEVLWAMEEGLRCRRLAAVVGEVEGLDRLAGRRLQLAAEASLDGQGPEAGLDETRAVTAFALHRRFRPPRAGRAPSAALSRWRVTAASSNDDLGESFIGRPCWRLDLLRCRGAAPGTWQVEWDDAACGFSLAPALCDRSLAASARPGPAAERRAPTGELVDFRQAG
jgi:protein ImuA